MNKNRRKSGRIVTLGSIMSAVVLGLATGTSYRKAETAIEVETETVGRRDIAEVVVAAGKVQPVTLVKISPEVSGEIIALPVKEGQPVKKGDLLLKIKPDYYQADRNSSEASYQYALANVDLAKATLAKNVLDLQRAEELFKSKLISDSQFLEAKTSYEVAKAQHVAAIHQADVARATLARTEEELSKTTIYSPITGTVSKLFSEVGERVVGTATMAGTEVMQLADLDQMEARVDVGEMDVALIQRGQTARLDVDAFRDRKFAGVVTEIANTANNAKTGSSQSTQSSQEATKFEVRIRVKDKASFRPGMSVSATIETRARSGVLAVPIQCVTTRVLQPPATEGGAAARPASKTPVEVVFVIEHGCAEARPVRRGISDESYVEITEGLAEGEQVVSGSYKAISRELENGGRVSTASLTAKAEGNGL